MTLLPQRQCLIDASGTSAEVARARGYRSAETTAELSRLGFTSRQQNVPALVIPRHDVAGERAGYLLRPDEPRQIRGRTCKYEAATIAVADRFSRRARKSARSNSRATSRRAA